MKQLTHVIVFVLALLGFSCQENSLVINSDPRAAQGKVSIDLESSPAGLTHVTAHLFRRGYDALTLSLITSDSLRSASGTFENVAVGMWHLRVDALDDSNIVRFTGETDVEVFPGETSFTDLELLPASGNIHIHVTWGTAANNSGLALYLPFDGSLEDSSGNRNDGVSNNAHYTGDPWGNANGAYLFNGKDNYITISNNSTINPRQQLTITFWLRVDSIQSNYMPIIAKGGPLSGYYFNNREYGVWTKQTFQYWYPQFKSAGDGQGMHELDSDHHSYVVGEWNFFAFVVDRVNHRMLMYADGQLTEQTDDSYSSFNVNSYPLMVGWSEENLFEHTPLRGAMDNLRIYKRALSPRQIQELYNSHK